MSTRRKHPAAVRRGPRNNAFAAPAIHARIWLPSVSFLKERGRSSGLCLVVVVVVFSDAVWVNAGEAWGPGSAVRPIAKRPQVLEAHAERADAVQVSGKAGRCPVVRAGWWVVVVVCSSAGGPRLVDRPEGGLSVIPSPRR